MLISSYITHNLGLNTY